MEILVEREIIGYGAGATHTSILANTPIKPGSVKVWGNIGTENLSGVDDGANGISGDHIVSGSINYSDGVITVEFDQSIPAGNEVFVSYFYLSSGVSDLNKVQYVSQDFQTLSLDNLQFLRKYFPEDYNDYVAASMGMSLVDINTYARQNLFWNLNRKVTDFYFPTAKSPTNISILGRTLGYKARGATAAIVPIQVTLPDAPYGFAVTIQKPFAFQGPSGLQFEYRGTVPIVFAPGESQKTFDVREGETRTDNFISDGENGQVFKILGLEDGQYIEDGSIKIIIDGVEWTEYDLLPFEQVEAFETNLIASPPTIKFGDGVQGIVPSENAPISVEYVVCSGFAGRIASNSIEEPVVPLTANFENITVEISQPSASAGGDDPEDSRSITVNAPLFQKTQDRAITKQDYDYLCNNYPNVAKADAQIIRDVSSDVIMNGVFSSIESYLSNLRAADRYLAPRPQISKIVFDKNLIEDDIISIDIDATTYGVIFITDNLTTLQTLAGELQADPKIESAIVSECSEGNSIVLTGVANESFTINNETVIGGGVATVTITELTPPPNQEQQIALDLDMSEGNVFSLEYDSTLISVPYKSDTATALNEMAAAIRDFAEAPEASINETQSVPEQVQEIVFNKNFFKGNLIKFYVKDLSITEPVDTLVQVNFSTDNLTTFNLIKTKLEALSFIESVVVDPGNNKLDVHTYPVEPQLISNEIVAYIDAVGGTSYSNVLINFPVRPLSIKIRIGDAIATADGVGNISGSGITGSINYATGSISLDISGMAPAPSPGTPIYINYLYNSPSRTIEFTSIEVTLNTVTVDETARTINVVTDSTADLSLANGVVTPASPAAITSTEVQSMIEEDLGSVAGIANDIESQCSTLKEYLNANLSDGCRANTVQVSLLSKDAARKYIAPPQSLLDELKTYLEERKDAVHTISTVSGFDKVIEVDIRIEVEIGPNAIEDDVVNTINDALKKSDSQPYGLMIEREFNVSLYLSKLYDAVTANLEKDRDFTYLNAIIEGPALHSTQLQDDEHITIGNDGVSQIVAYTTKYQPIVENYVYIKVDGVTVAEDDGNEVISEVLGSSYTVLGSVHYQTGQIDFEITPAPASNESITVSYYKSLLDRRGNLICPEGHVLQYGLVNIDVIPRAL